jgi:urocanate hydratase
MQLVSNVRFMRLAICVASFLFITTKSNAQSTLTEFFKIKIECDDNKCKKRLEDSFVQKGAKTAEWDSLTRTLTIVYDPKKMDIDVVRNYAKELANPTSTASSSINNAH